MTAPHSTLPLMPNNTDCTTSSTHDSESTSTTNIEKRRNKSKNNNSNKNKKKFQISKETQSQNHCDSISKSPKSRKKSPSKVSLSPRKKKDRSKSAEAVSRVISEGHTSTKSNYTANSFSATTAQEPQQSTEKTTRIHANTKSHLETASDASSTNPNTAISNTSSANTPSTSSSQSTTIQKPSSKSSKFRNKKSSRKTTMTNKASDQTTPIDKDRASTGNVGGNATEHQQSVQTSSSDSANTKFDNSQTNHQQSSNSSNQIKSQDPSFVKPQQTQSQRNIHKGYKGYYHSRKPYYVYNKQRNYKSNKHQTNHAVQERDVHNDKSHVEDDTRTAFSPLFMKPSATNNVDEMAALNLNGGHEGIPASSNDVIISTSTTCTSTKSSSKVENKEKPTDVIFPRQQHTSASTQYSISRSSRGGKYHTEKKSGKYLHEKASKGSLKYQRQGKTYTQGEVNDRTRHDASLEEEENQSAQLHSEDKTVDTTTDSRPASPSSSSNVVTTNAAGQALLKRLGGSVTSTQEEGTSPDGLSASTEVDVDFDASTAFSGDVSGISMEPSHDHEQQQPMMYPNPIVFPPFPPSQQQQRMDETMLAPNNNTPFVTVPTPQQQQQQQQQWIMPPQSDLSPQEYNNMMAYYNQQQYPMYAPTVIVSPYGMGNNTMQAMSAPSANFYSQSLPVHMPPIPQMYQQQAIYSAPPKPVKYEQVTVGGCVYFNPVYEVVGEEEAENNVLSGNSVETFSTENKTDDEEARHGTGSNKSSADKAVSKKQEFQKRKNKSKKRKTKQYTNKSKEKKSTKKEN